MLIFGDISEIRPKIARNFRNVLLEKDEEDHLDYRVRNEEALQIVTEERNII